MFWILELSVSASELFSLLFALKVCQDLSGGQPKCGQAEDQLLHKVRQVRRYIPAALGTLYIESMYLLTVCIGMIHGLQRDACSPRPQGILHNADLVQTTNFAAVLSCAFGDPAAMRALRLCQCLRLLMAVS